MTTKKHHLLRHNKLLVIVWFIYEFFVVLQKLFNEYNKCFVDGVDNVGSKQMQQIRIALRQHAGKSYSINYL